MLQTRDTRTVEVNGLVSSAALQLTADLWAIAIYDETYDPPRLTVDLEEEVTEERAEEILREANARATG